MMTSKLFTYQSWNRKPSVARGMITWLSSFILLMWWITLIDVQKLNQPCIPMHTCHDVISFLSTARFNLYFVKVFRFMFTEVISLYHSCNICQVLVSWLVRSHKMSLKVLPFSSIFKTICLSLVTNSCLV